MMKIFKLVFIILLGLITAFLLYPFLHELGHGLAAILMGEKIKEFALFPTPYIGYEMTEVKTCKIIIIGLSGMVFPVIFSLVIYSTNFWMWLIGLYLNVICLISFVISIIACVNHLRSTPIINEDVTQILDMTSGNAWIWIAFFILLTFLLIVQIIKSKPITRCYELK